MRRTTLFLIAALALIFALTSCQTAKVEQEPQVVEIILRIEIVDVPAEKPASEEPALVEEPVVISEPEVTEESVVASEPEVVWTVGETGPNGGLVFECEGRYLEMAEPFYEVSNFDASIALVAELAAESGVMYRLPTIVELTNLYDQLVLSGINEDIEWTYYWSSEEVDEASAKVMNFDTGFEGQFYKSMDFLGVIPVVEL
ncbi:MAG TPA: hypothetical protein DCP98_08720 [Sphaerochaeta sp.]|nr:hypothetical protein [Sphaerochaeta sp.]